MAILRSRISGRELESPSGVVASFLGVVGGEGAGATVNGFAVEPGGHLVPDRSGRVRVGQVRGVTSFDLPTESLIDDDHARSISVVTNGLLSPAQHCDCDWDRCVGISPVMSVVDEPVDLTDVDRAVKDTSPSLVDVCRKPRTNLVLELERVPTPRAKRIPQRAASYLASHPEDWTQPTLTGPLPKRVLAEMADESLDVFENRVVARLIDRAESHVALRIRRLRRLELLLRDLFEQEDLLTAHWAKKNRLYTLLAPLLSEQHRLFVTQHTIEALTQLRYRLLGLTDSDLYQEIPRRATVPHDLPSTNILVNDPRYRRARDLWLKLSPSSAATTLGDEALHTQMVQRFADFDQFCFLLVLQGLERCGARPHGVAETVCLGKRLELAHPACDELYAQFDLSDRTIRVVSGKRQLKLVPVYAAIGNMSESDVQAMSAHIHEACREVVGDVVILHPDSLERAGDVTTRESRKARMCGDEDNAGGRRVSVLSVSPWRVGSSDDVTRAINWFVYGTRYAELPPVIALSPVMDAWAKKQGGWLENIAHGRWRVLRPDIPAHWLREFKELEVRARGLRQEIESIERPKKGTRRPPDELRKERLRLAQVKDELSRTERAASAASETEVAVEAALAAWRSVMRCPVCGDEDIASDIRARTFWCTCRSCHSNWGTRWCKACETGIAAILPFSTQWADWLRQGKPASLLAGSDLLALPTLGEGDKVLFQCRNCGNSS